MPQNPGIPALFRDIFKNAYLPYRDPETLKSFLKIINEFSYDHSERLGDAFEYLLSVLGSQGDAGQFRTPRHIINTEQYTDLATNPIFSLRDLRAVPAAYRALIPNYVKDYVSLNQFAP